MYIPAEPLETLIEELKRRKISDNLNKVLSANIKDLIPPKPTRSKKIENYIWTDFKELENFCIASADKDEDVYMLTIYVGDDGEYYVKDSMTYTNKVAYLVSKVRLDFGYINLFEKEANENDTK